MAKRKQGHLEGMEPESIAEVDRAAEAYVAKRDLRMSALKDEVELGNELLAVMKDHKLKTYEFDGYVVTVSSLEKVKVKRNGQEDEGDD